MHRSTPLPSNTPHSIHECGLCIQSVVLKSPFRVLHSTENIYYILLMDHSECKCVSVSVCVCVCNLLRKDKPKGSLHAQGHR